MNGRLALTPRGWRRGRAARAFPVLLAALALGGCRDADSRRAVSDRPLPTATALPAPPRAADQTGPAAPRRVAFDPADRDRLLVVEANGTTSVWSVADPERPVKEVALATPASDGCFLPGGRSIVTAGRDGSIRRWDAERETWATPATRSGPRAVLAVASDASAIAASGEDGAIRLWSADGAALGAIEAAHRPFVVSLAFSPRGAWLASEGADSVARLWRRSDDSRSRRGAGERYEAAVVVRQATPPYDRMLPNLVRWDVQWGWGRSVAFSPGGDLLVTANLDGTGRIWNLDGSPRTSPFTDHGKHHVRAVDFSPRGDVVATAGFDGTVRLWKVDGSATDVRLAHPGIVTSVAFAADGERIATAAMDERVRVWGRDGKLEAALPASARRRDRTDRSDPTDRTAPRRER